MKHISDFHKGITLGMIPLFLSVIGFAIWAKGIQDSLIEQTTLLSQVVVDMHSDKYLNSDAARAYENKLMACLTSQIRSLDEKVFLDPRKLGINSISESVEIINDYWAVPVFP